MSPPVSADAVAAVACSSHQCAGSPRSAPEARTDQNPRSSVVLIRGHRRSICFSRGAGPWGSRPLPWDPFSIPSRFC
eukprot:9334595-Pyramimonas_sp.AAC.1